MDVEGASAEPDEAATGVATQQQIPTSSTQHGTRSQQAAVQPASAAEGNGRGARVREDDAEIQSIATQQQTAAKRQRKPNSRLHGFDVEGVSSIDKH
jgi:hypothetical protein